TSRSTSRSERAARRGLVTPRRADHAIAPFALGAEQQLITAAGQRRDVVTVLRVVHDAGRERDLDLAPIHAQRRGFDLGPHLIELVLGLGRIRLRERHGELLATVAPDDVGATERIAKYPREHLERRVTRGVAEPIVDRL